LPPPRPSKPITLNIKYSAESDVQSDHQRASDIAQVTSLKSQIADQEAALKTAQEEVSKKEEILRGFRVEKEQMEKKLLEIDRLE